MARDTQEDWPELPLEAWQDTYATLHMWSQIVGKVRLALGPRINHWWEVPLYVSALGLTTSAIPYPEGNFEVEFDFIHHRLTIKTSQNTAATVASDGRSTVADFYRDFMAALGFAGHRGENLANARGDSESDRVRSGYAARFLRPGIREPFLADSGEQRKDFHGIPRAVHRQSQPGAFFLGEFRSGGDAIFRAAALRNVLELMPSRAKHIRMR